MWQIGSLSSVIPQKPQYVSLINFQLAETVLSNDKTPPKERLMVYLAKLAILDLLFFMDLYKTNQVSYEFTNYRCCTLLRHSIHNSRASARPHCLCQVLQHDGSGAVSAHDLWLCSTSCSTSYILQNSTHQTLEIWETQIWHSTRIKQNRDYWDGSVGKDTFCLSLTTELEGTQGWKRRTDSWKCPLVCRHVHTHKKPLFFFKRGNTQ